VLAHSSQPDDLVDSYSFDLRAGSIAQLPSEQRDASRLLVVDRDVGEVHHHKFEDLPQFLKAEDLVVANDTRVLPARLFGHKVATGGAVELLALHPLEGADRWAALVRPSAKIKVGTAVDVARRGAGGTAQRIVIGEHLPDGQRVVHGLSPAVLQSQGEMPLPPYIERKDAPQQADLDRYQTVYATHSGAAAAPTAGLHFTPSVLDKLSERGVGFERLTLHVGAGTFQPVRTERLSEHLMHSERFAVPRPVAERVERCEARGGRLLAVGTTSCRSLETWHRLARPHDGLERHSKLFLHPDNPPQLAMSLLTNFHLPKSTLLMLVAAFLGRQRTLRIYKQAQELGYRFYSYGDAMLIL
jgi:S-adenosylmethionine:tRNA ribosyltransferase-isomerase